MSNVRIICYLETEIIVCNAQVCILFLYFRIIAVYERSREHHDYVPLLAELPCGPRILTFFLYLSDVEGGGGTNFPELDITIEPKRGRALIWPSVYNNDPMAQDPRMSHQALEVTAGTKFAANGWFHMYDFETPNMMGCL